jgi:ABC-type dipeptide/oligopeptide/nickel transport system permease component
MFSLLLALIVGFVAGLLVARKNKAKVDAAVEVVQAKLKK